MVSVRVKQSTTFGALMTIAIALITLGVARLNETTEEWYIGLAIISVGLVMIVVDAYILKGQEQC